MSACSRAFSLMRLYCLLGIINCIQGKSDQGAEGSVSVKQGTWFCIGISRYLNYYKIRASTVRRMRVPYFVRIQMITEFVHQAVHFNDRLHQNLSPVLHILACSMCEFKSKCISQTSKAAGIQWYCSQ